MNKTEETTFSNPTPSNKITLDEYEDHPADEDNQHDNFETDGSDIATLIFIMPIFIFFIILGILSIR